MNTKLAEQLSQHFSLAMKKMSKPISGRQANWLQFQNIYFIDIRNVSDKENTVTDTLSHLPVPGNEAPKENDNKGSPGFMYQIVNPIQQVLDYQAMAADQGAGGP